MLTQRLTASQPSPRNCSTMVAGADQLVALTGARAQSPINRCVYGDTRRMQEAVLDEPAWTGGQAFPANNMTIIGISPRNLAWGRRAIVHELTHLIVGQLTFSCGENMAAPGVVPVERYLSIGGRP